MQSINTTPWIPGVPFGALSFREEDDSFGQPTPALPSYTEFYCEAGGSNLNAGSNTGAAIYSSAAGNWSSVTNAFTPTDGVNPFTSGVRQHQWASIYVTVGATVATFIARITSVVNAVNGAITVSAAAATFAGVIPTTGAGTFTIKVGGAWLGPNAASGFPFILAHYGDNRDILLNKIRTNLKNNQTYSLSAAFSFDTVSVIQQIVQGYSVTPGDGGKATLDSTAAQILTSPTIECGFRDLIFTTSFASGTTDMIVGGGHEWSRCVFKNARGYGITLGNDTLNECEIYNCGLGGSKGGASIAGATIILRTISHHNTGSGFVITSTGVGVSISNMIAAANSGSGVNFTSVGNGPPNQIVDSDFYNNAVSGITIASTRLTPFWIENCIFVKNAQHGIDNPSNATGFSYNNAYGSNGQNNVLTNLNEIGEIYLGDGVIPWTDPDNGNFSLSLSTLNFVGRGAFTFVASYSSSTTGYPAVGAAQPVAVAPVSAAVFNPLAPTIIIPAGVAQ